GEDEAAAVLQTVRIRTSAGGDQDDVGILGQTTLRFGQEVVAELGARCRATLQAPIYDADELAAAPAACRQATLTAGFGGSFENHDVVTALRRHPRCLQSRRA